MRILNRSAASLGQRAMGISGVGAGAGASARTGLLNPLLENDQEIQSYGTV